MINNALDGLDYNFTHSNKPHIFDRIVFDLIPEINIDELMILNQRIKIEDSEIKYKSLKDCLIKIQFSKLSALEARHYEDDVKENIEDNPAFFFHFHYIQFTKAIMEFISNIKSSLDSFSHFLNIILKIDIPVEKSSKIDLKIKQFREKVNEKNKLIGDEIIKILSWLDISEESDSIITTRDRWIHRLAPQIKFFNKPKDFGCFPIPKKLDINYLDEDQPETDEFYWKLSDFIDFHYMKMVNLFNNVITIINKEANTIIDKNSPTFKSIINLIPKKAYADDDDIRIFKEYSPVFINASKLVESLRDKIFKGMQKGAVDDFIKLSSYRVIRHKNKNINPFLFQPFNTEINFVDFFNIEKFNYFNDFGLLNLKSVNFNEFEMFINGYRGFKLINCEKNNLTIPFISYTTLGARISETIFSDHFDPNYTDKIKDFLIKNSINFQLLSITDYNQDSYKYDTLGTF